MPGPESFALSLLRALSFIILLSSTSFASYLVHPFVAAPGDKPLNDPAPHPDNSGELEKAFIKAPVNRLYPLSVPVLSEKIQSLEIQWREGSFCPS